MLQPSLKVKQEPPAQVPALPSTSPLTWIAACPGAVGQWASPMRIAATRLEKR